MPTDNKLYLKGLTKTYGYSQQYQYTGKRCSKNCKNFVNYEAHHSSDCPFYKGSMSEKYDNMEKQLNELKRVESLSFEERFTSQEQANRFMDTLHDL